MLKSAVAVAVVAATMLILVGNLYAVSFVKAVFPWADPKRGYEWMP